MSATSPVFNTHTIESVRLLNKSLTLQLPTVSHLEYTSTEKSC